MVIHDTDFGDKLIEDYLSTFGNYSFRNELYGKISLHVILGQALKNVYYRMGSRKIDIRVNLLFIKPQGTGKGAGYGFVEKMSKNLDLEFKSLTESTDAGLVGTLEYDKSTKQSVPVYGLLKDADIIGMEEASVLFDFSNEFSKKNMTYMQITMNPLSDSSCHISKKLGTEMIEFKPHASFVLMSYPPDKLADKILKTGFVDRVIPVFEDVTIEDRLSVIKQMSENVNVSTPESYEEKFISVAKRLKIIIDSFQKGDICVTIPDDVHRLLLGVIDELAQKILDASPKAREKLEHFISRLYETLLKLSIHHSLLSRRTNLDISDVIYARITYLPIWINLIISIESLLIIAPAERARRHRIIRTAINEYDKQIKIKSFVRDKVWVRRPTMLENLQVLWDNCSLPTADNNLRKLEKLPEFEYSKITKYEKDKFFERKYFGDVAYLKKIKEI